MITMLVIALMLVLSLTVLSACGKKMYQLTVTGGTGGGEYSAGTVITITADTPETGKKFTGWTLDGVSVDDKTEAELTFTMPESNVTATANYEYIDYAVTVTGGTANKTTAHYGDTVTITANEPETGKEFTGWTIEGVTVENTSVDELTFTMPAGNVTATANYEYIDYTVTVNGGTANKTTAHYGDSITITAAAPEKGKRFTGWTINGVSVDDKTKAEITFTMPANAVTATANYGDVLYEFALENCTADKESAKFGEQVTFTADEVIGKRFDSWNIKGVDDLTGLDLTKSPLTITMPANDINVAAVLEDIDYTVTVTGGTANKTTAHYGDSITITAEIPTGMSFAGWTLEGITAETGGFSINFTMPANNVTATAKYVYNNYNVTVNGGTANKTTAHYGDSITIKAEIPTGMSFVGWTLEGVTADTSGFSINFTMPANNVTATAKYVYNNYNVTVNGGKAQVNDGVASASVKAHYGEEVTITAEVPVGKEFVRWSFNGLVSDGLTLTDAELTFTMPTNAVTATAVFEDIDYEVKVVCRNTETKTAHYGEEVTITAENIEGKIFVCWAFTNLDTEGLDLTRAELSFTMPANNVTAKAIYEELITLTFEGTTAQSEELKYKDNDSKSFRLPLGAGQDICTYTIELSNSAFTFKVYGSDGVEIKPYDNGDGFMCIDIAREDNYTIRVINTGAAANCKLTVTQI